MNIFADWAEIYWDLGYSIIPIKKGTKAPFLDYSQYRKKQCDEKTLHSWIEKYPDANIAIVTGEASGLAVIDIDIKGQDDLLNKALSVFPRSPLERFGSKGLGIFIKYNGQSGRKLKYKSKEIGEVITNTVIVIPPSIHPDTGKEYKWTGYLSLDADLKENLVEELPCPTDEELAACEFALENSDAEVDKSYFKETVSRNNKLKSICGSMINKGMMPEEMAPLLMAEDIILHKNKALFSDHKEFKGLADNPLAAAYMFSSSIFRTYLNGAKAKQIDVPHFSRKKVKKAGENVEYSKYKEFFINTLKNAKKDKIDSILKVKDWRGFWQPVGNQMGALRSYGSDKGLRPDRLANHFARYQKEMKSELLFDVVPWDGKDHIAEMFKYVQCSNMTQSQTVELVKQWIAKAIVRVDSGEQNTMILFQGKQGAGKDIFIENLCGGFAPYFANFTDTIQEKDIFMQIAKNLIINISEFDKLNKKHPGMVKDLISRRTAEFRPSHMQHFENFRMNSSFIGSVNGKDFLTDHTGNRRFWVFQEVEIDWGYPKGLGAQILAQAKALAAEEYEASETTIAAMNKSVLDISPDSVDDLIRDVWNETFTQCLKYSHKLDGILSYSECVDAFRQVKDLCGLRSLRSAQSAIKRLGGQHPTRTSKRFYRKIEDRTLEKHPDLRPISH